MSIDGTNLGCLARVLYCAVGYKIFVSWFVTTANDKLEHLMCVSIFEVVVDVRHVNSHVKSFMFPSSPKSRHAYGTICETVKTFVSKYD